MGKSDGKTVGTWLHMSAMNLVAEHDAGGEVPPGQLAIARRLVAELGISPARALPEDKDAA